MLANGLMGSGTEASNIRARLGALLREYYEPLQHGALPDRISELVGALARRLEEQKRSPPPTETPLT
jgi:hypothetical protein